jgi:glucosamine--fructose-6-phosphate aminotransferase (isomerizing)
MCGIFGFFSLIKNKNIYNIIIDGLLQLQNRGYDSCGISVLNKDVFEIYKYASTINLSAIDKIKNLNLMVKSDDMIYQGIGHNRWATHGEKNDINSHPHISNGKQFVLVHNGIIENYLELKIFLQNNGYTFYSQTDTEIVVNLIEYNYSIFKDTYQSIKKTIDMIEGTYAIILMNNLEPNKIYTFRNSNPILIGISNEHIIITSELSGFCNLVNEYIILDNKDICIIEKNENKLLVNKTNEYIWNKFDFINNDLTPYPYKHWTIKEIFEQPSIIKKLCDLKIEFTINRKIDNIIILGCGTSFFAGLYGMYYFKKFCKFNTVQVFDGAEFTNLDIPTIGNTAILFISQSGETNDLYRCLPIAKEHNCLTIGIINVKNSLIAREVNNVIYTNAGREMGVASTKSFTAQVICLSLLALKLSDYSDNDKEDIIKDLNNLSDDFLNTINDIDEQVKMIANQFLDKSNNLFILGKSSDECIAKEGSLKIKEISYIHSEGYSASSLKHGPFALLCEDFPVILINCIKEYTNKILNSFEEIHSRKSPIIFITNNKEINFINKNSDNIATIYVKFNKTYASLMAIIPLQLLAYYLAINRNINPDIPKNLAKVVTVE